MSSAEWLAVVGGVVVLLVAALLAGAALGARRAERRAHARESALAAQTRAEVDALRARVEELSGRLEQQAGKTAAARTTGGGPDPSAAPYVITSAGELGGQTPAVPDRMVLSATVGEPLVKLAAFGYGLRRALSAESRNRIAFQMRREVRRARKERRRAARRTRTAERSAA